MREGGEEERGEGRGESGEGRGERTEEREVKQDTKRRWPQLPTKYD